MWSEEDIKFLYANPSMSLADIAAALKRSESAIKAKRSRLKIRTDVNKPWTAEERRILQLNYNRVSAEEVRALLPGRSAASIRSQALYLRKRQWNI
tara:strand:+ start:455 stop:742 length:288 start_codon:yes stop_codon:yes gene_type:complete